MIKKIVLVFSVFFYVLTAVGQDNKKVLLTLNGKPVYTSEFKRVYKKNLDLVKDESQKNVEDYLGLFIDYKLKVAEAYAQQLNEKETYKKEFSQYQEQLSRNYILENKITEDMAREAYDRSLEEVKAAHILIKSSYNDTPQDTLAAYNKINDIRKKALAGEDFETLAKTYSEEPGANERAGNLGYFTAFSMVYPFENAAYNTKVSEVSKIVRTSFGYHILKVQDRRKRAADIVVSHIMVAGKNDASNFDPKERIDELYALLQQGEPFESIAKQYSDDKASAKNNGQLLPFGRGALRSKAFEDAAFELKNPGDVSQPIKSEFGWHILRLDERKTDKPFSEMKETLEKRVLEGDRSKIVTSALNDLIKKKYVYKKLNNYNPFFETFVSEDVLNRKWKYETLPSSQDKALFSIGTRTENYSDFAEYINTRQKTTRPFPTKSTLLSELYEEFETIALKKYLMDELENENEEYASIIKEYRAGLLIFDVMDQNIWTKAKLDTVGLQNFYEQHKNEYVWKQRADVTIVSTSDSEIAARAKELLSNNSTNAQLKETLNTNEKINVIITNGVYEKDAQELPKDLEMKEGVSKIFQEDGSYILVKVNAILPPGIKKLEEVKGRVISEYQNYLEKQWLESLHKKYDVKVNQKVFKNVKKELES